MTEKQLYHFNYVLNQLSKRILPIYFYNHSKEKMCQWQNQICLQSHVIAAYYLDKYLKPKGYEVYLYESIFEDSVMKIQYNHSWLWIGSPNRSITNRYLCDIARVSSHIGLVKTKPYRNTHSVKPFCVDKEITKLRKVHFWKELFLQNEYYTNKTGPEIIKDIDQMLIDARLSFEHY